MEELPKIDLPEEWLIGTAVNKELLNLYTNFPCRLKSDIFVLCMKHSSNTQCKRRTHTLFRRLLIKIHRTSLFNPFIYQYFIYNDRKTCHFIKTGRNQIISGILSILDKIIRLFQ